MLRYLEQRVRPAVRVFAAAGLVFAGSVQLGWSPTTPWAPAATVVRAAAKWPVTAPVVIGILEAVGVVRWQIMYVEW